MLTEGGELIKSERASVITSRSTKAFRCGQVDKI